MDFSHFVKQLTKINAEIWKLCSQVGDEQHAAAMKNEDPDDLFDFRQSLIDAGSATQNALTTAQNYAIDQKL